MRLRLLSTACFAATVLVAAPAVCDEPRERVKFVLLRGSDVDEARCGTSTSVINEIERGLKRRDVFQPDAEWLVEVVVTFEDGRFHARIDEQRPGQARTSLPSKAEIPGGAADCPSLMKWVAMQVTGLIEQNPLNKPDSRKPLIGSTAKPRTYRHEQPLAMTAALRSGVRYGFVPGLASETSLFAGFGQGRWEASIGFSWTLESRTTKRLENEFVAYGFTMNVVWIGGCFHPLRSARAILSTCAHLGVGASNGTVISSETPVPLNAGQTPWVGAGLQPRLRLFPLPRLAIEFGADLTVPFTSHKYSFCKSVPSSGNCPATSVENVFEQTLFGVAGFFGMGLSIP